MMKSMLKLASRIWAPLRTSVRHSLSPTTYRHYLQNKPGTQYSILSNGIIVATEERETCCVSLGFYIDGGSRYESETENGIAHLFEQIAFKGTSNRNEQQVAEEMASFGARFGSSTDRELVTFTVDCLSQDTPRAFDLLVDSLFNNSYCGLVVEKQKQIVYWQMLQNDKNPNAVLMDYLHASAFQGTSLGRSVMGTSANLSCINAELVAKNRCRAFDPARIVLAAAGGLQHEYTVELANMYLGRMQPQKPSDPPEYRYTGSDVRYRDDSLPVGIVAIAVEGPGLCNEDHMVMEVARQLLGAWDRSQPGGVGPANFVARHAALDQLCHAYKGFNITYKDSALWGVQFVADPLKLDDMTLIAQEHLMYLCVAVTEEEVARGCRMLKAQLMSQLQGLPGVRDDIGVHSLYLGCRPSVLERLASIDKLTASDVHAVCSKYLYDRDPVVAAIGPLEALNDYNRIRAGMYWMRY